VKCLVSGATGFVGRHLCRELRQRGHEYLPLSRHGAALTSGIATLGIDLATEVPDAAVFEGVETAFHLAGIAHRSAAEEEYTRLNEGATLALAERAAAAGVRNFVFLSSVKAMGEPTTGAPRSEDDLAPPADPYGRSKWRAECALRETFRDGPMSVVILRPTLVYGVGVKGNLRALATAVSRGLPRPPAGGRRSLLSAGDLANLLCEVAATPAPGVRTFIAAGDESHSLRDLHDMLRTALDGAVATAWLPGWAWRLGAALADRAAGTPGANRARLFGSELYSGAAVQAATGWRPRQTFDQLAADILQASLE